MKHSIKTITIVSASSVLMACGGFGDDDFSSDVNDVTFSSGSLNVDKYVAIGDSLTAGFADGALYKDGQINSFPNILAQAFSEVGGGSFTQPLVNDNLGGLLFGGVANPQFDVRLVLSADASGTLGPVRQNVVTPSATPTTEVTTSPIAGLYNNLGVPGAKSFHLTVTTATSPTTYGDVAGLAGGTANPFFVRFRSAAATTIIADAIAQTPSFFSLWIGNNDILGYATSGGTGNDSSTTTAYGTGANDITDPVNVFAPTYNGIIAGLTSIPDIQGILINIPAITSIPFFTTVPFNAIPLDQASADAANAAFVDYNNALNGAVAGAFSGLGITMTQAEADRRRINFVAGQNAVLILDESLTDLTPASAALLNFRQATAEDFILLPLSSTC